MTHQPDIVISTLDLKRLESLLNTLPDKDTPGVLSLEEELERATVVEPSQIPDNVVSMNSTVEFSVSSSDETFRLTLVYPKDMKSDGSTISVLAPVGSALLGLKQGDEIDWPGPNGETVKVQIKNILYQPEREGDFLS
jgi:regulator of nucleoside diphosphate kinase